MKKYKRLTAIDYEIKELKRLKEDVLPGSQYNPLGTESYATITIKIEHKTMGVPWHREKTYELFARNVIGLIDAEIRELREEKASLLNKKWWEFWK